MGELDTSYQKKTVSERIAEQQRRLGITPTIRKTDADDAPVKKENLPEAPSVQDEEGGFMHSVGEFLKELPEQTLSGIGEAVNKTLTTAKDIGKAVGIPDVGIQITNEQGEFDLGVFGTKESAKGRSAEVIPVADEAKTLAGGMARSIAQFAAGFVPASKALGAAGLASGVARGLAAGAVTGAVAMDPHEARLSTMLNEVPVLKDIVPDYLADNNPENESVWEGRLKNAIDMTVGSAIGEAAAAGAVKMFKAYKVARVAKNTKAAEGETPEAAIKAAGEAMQAKEEALDEVARAAAGKPTATPEELRWRIPGQDEVFINTNTMKVGSDNISEVAATVERVMRNAAEKSGFETPRTNFAQIKHEGRMAFKDINDLLGREIERPFTRGEAIAAKELLLQSSKNLKSAVDAARGVTKSPETILRFKQALALHNDVQNVVFTGRAATAQSLGAWRITAKSSGQRAKQINTIMEKLNMKRLDEQLEILANTPDEALSGVAAKLTDPKWSDAAYQVWVNGILSGPQTHAANVVSNMGTTIGAVAEKYVSAGFDAIAGRGMQGFTEANAKAFGFLSGIKDTFRLLKGSDDIFKQGSKLEMVGRESAITHRLIGASDDSFIGKAVNYMGKAVNLPGMALERGDMFFKGLNYRMALYEDAAIQANAAGLKGKELRTRIAELVTNPSEAMQDAAAQFARVQTFTNEGGAIIKGLQGATQNIPGLRYVLPFVRTPGNIFKYGFERTPLAIAFKETRQALAAGGVQRSTALAKMTMGSTIMAGAAAMTLDGNISGSGPLNKNEKQALMATGWQPYSIKVGDKWVSYARLEPIGSLMGYAADVASIMGSDDLTDEERENLVANGLAAFSQAFSQKTFVSGAASLLNAITSGNPGEITNYLQNQASTLVPFSGAGKTATRYFDDVKKDFRPDDTMGFLRSTIEKMKESTGVLSADAPPLRDIWGKEMSWTNGVVNSLSVVSPIRYTKDDPDPVNRFIAERQISIGRPSRRMDGVKLNNKEYSEYSKMVGETAKKFMDRMITNPGFTKMNNEQSQYIVDKIFNNARDMARKKLIKGNLDLQERIRAKKLETNERLRR